jgi:DNA-binding NarL/FixJ family response regulator
MSTIRIGLLGTQQVSGQIAELLQPHADLELTISTCNWQQLGSVAALHIVLLEVTSELPDPFALLGSVQTWHPNARAILLAHEMELRHVCKIRDTEIMGYLLVDAAFDGLVTAIRLVHAGKLMLSSQIVPYLSAPL